MPRKVLLLSLLVFLSSPSSAQQSGETPSEKDINRLRRAMDDLKGKIADLRASLEKEIGSLRVEYEKAKTAAHRSEWALATFLAALIVVTVLLVIFGILMWKSEGKAKEAVRDAKESAKEAEKAVEQARASVAEIEELGKKAEESLQEQEDQIKRLVEKKIEEIAKESGKRLEILELFHEARLAYSTADYDGAVRLFTEVIKLDPNYAAAYNNRGNAWAMKGECGKAIEDFTKAIELNPRFAVAYYNRGNAWVDKGEYDRAIADFTKAIELFEKAGDMKNAAMAYNNRGSVRSELAKQERDEKRRQELLEKAMADYDRALELKELLPDKGVAAYYGRARAAALKGDRQAMLESLRKAVELDPVYKKKAKEDEDFKEFRGDEEFKRLVSG